MRLSAIGETSDDPAIGLKLGIEPRFERYQPSAIAAVCSRSFRDALQRIARYKKLTCPEEIRVRTAGEEACVEFIYLQAEELQPDVLVAFFRAFHGWEGTSPGEWRTRHRASEAVA